MKMYTSDEQTAKLIELGFEKPNIYLGLGTKEEDGSLKLGYNWAYPIGELIEMLHNQIIPIRIAYDKGGFDNVHYEIRVFIDGMWCTMHERDNAEMIDFLFEAIVKLKEEGVM